MALRRRIPIFMQTSFVAKCNLNRFVIRKQSKCNYVNNLQKKQPIKQKKEYVVQPPYQIIG